MQKLEFIAVCDLFMTPTAQMADIVLPASSWLERDNLISSFQVCPTYTIAQQKAAEVPEARSDVDIVCALARKLGLAEHFWNDAGEALRLPHQTHRVDVRGIQGTKTDFCALRLPAIRKEWLSQHPFGEGGALLPRSSKRTGAPPCPPTPSPPQAPRPPRNRRRSIPRPDDGLAAAGLPAHGKPGKPAPEGNSPTARSPHLSRYRNAAGNLGGGPGHCRDRDGKRNALCRSHPGDTPRRRVKPCRAGGGGPTSTGSSPGIDSPKGSAPYRCGGSSAVSERE